MSDAEENLKLALRTFQNRNAVYGASYQEFGPFMAALFPDGLQLKTSEEFGRFGAFTMCAVKLHRYAQALRAGRAGHEDSAHDLICYAAILQELTE